MGKWLLNGQFVNVYLSSDWGNISNAERPVAEGAISQDGDYLISFYRTSQRNQGTVHQTGI